MPALKRCLLLQDLSPRPPSLPSLTNSWVYAGRYPLPMGLSSGVHCLTHARCCSRGTSLGGRPATAPDVDPPPPLKMAKMCRRFRPHLAPEAPEICFKHLLGGLIFVSTSSVCTQNAQKFMVNPNMYAKHDKFF